MNDKNLDIKGLIRQKGLKQWQVAECYGINEGNFSRLLRKELTAEKKEKVMQAIEQAQKEYEIQEEKQNA